MFGEQWAHRALAWTGGFVLLAVVVYAGFQGWLWWLWPDAQSWLMGISKPVLDRLPEFEKIERASRVLGALGTAATAAFGVYTGLYYARHNLPCRLRELLQKTDARLLQDRGPLLAAIADQRHGADADKSVFYVGSLNRALEEMGFARYARADKSLETAHEEMEERIATSKSHLISMEEQKVAAHIFRGSIASARAETSSSPDEDRALAEQEFANALQIRPNDFDALELRGRQRHLLNNEMGALADFEQLVAVAIEAGKPIQIARGFRGQARVYEQRGTNTSLADARDALAKGIQAVNAVGSLRQQELFEKGLLLTASAHVQAKRKKLPTARNLLNDAIACFQTVDTQAARDRERDATQYLREITPQIEEAPNLLGRLIALLRRPFS
jgi:hypothetical protein